MKKKGQLPGKPVKAEALGRTDLLRRSDVVLSWGDFDARAEEACRVYGATVWGWGPSAMYLKSDEEVKRQVEVGHGLGIRLIMGMVCETIKSPPSAGCYREFKEDAELDRSECVDVAGKSIAPHWWDIDYGHGDRSWWNCANNPAFADFFRDKAARAIKAGADGLFIDGILSNRQVVEHAGCYCEHCMEGFRKYLAGKYSAQELAEKGIEDVAKFNYRETVAATAPDRPSLLKALKDGVAIPLLHDFREFQMEADVAFIKSVIAAARKAGGEGIPSAGNACMLLPDWLACGEFLDFMVTELSIWPEPGHMPVLALKIAEALGTPLAFWPVGPSVEEVRKGGYHGLVRIWIALSYAMGGNMMIPHAMWASAHESGKMTLYDAPVDKTVPLYRMVKGHAELFDGYDGVAQVALLYSNEDRRRGSKAVNKSAFDLLNANIPFALELASDRRVPGRAATSEEALAAYDAVVVPGDSLEGTCLPLVSLEQGDGVWVLPRIKRDQPGAPVVVHVVNHDYTCESDTLNPKEDLVVRVDPRLLDHRQVKAVSVVMPGKEPEALPVETGAGGALLVRLPAGDIWWIIRIERA